MGKKNGARKMDQPVLIENSRENLPQASSEPAFLPYLLKAVLVSVAIAASVQFVDRCGVWLFSLLCLLLAVPIFSQLAYFRAIRRSHWLLVFCEGGRVRRYLSGVVWRLIVSSLIGLALAFVMVFRLRALAWQEWLTCAAAIPVFWIVAHFFARKFVQEADPRFHVFVRVRLSSWLTVPVLLLIYGALITGFSDPSASGFAPWTHQGNEDQIISATVGELDALHQGWRALEAFVLGRISDLGEWGRTAAVVIFVVGNAAFFYGCASMLACFCIPQTELSRAFRQATTSAEPPAPTLAHAIISSALATIVVCALYLPSAAMIEASLMQLPPERRPMRQVRELVTAVQAGLQPTPVQVEGISVPPLRQAEEITPSVEVNPRLLSPERSPRQSKIIVERIGDQFYRVGTIKEANDARLSLLSSHLQALDMLTREINSGFDLMEENIDVFLDWYYSLPAEYTRLAKILTGSFEGYLTENFSAILSQGAPFEEFEKRFSGLLESDSTLRRKYQATLERIFSGNSVTIDNPNRIIVADEIDDPSAILSYKSVIASAQTRLMASGFFAGVAGTSSAAVGVKVTGAASKKITALVGKGIAKTIAKKIATKNAFKAAAKVAAKVAVKAATSKAASGVGMVVGGAIGSIVPIAGTTAGAIAGGVIVGLAFGVGADALLLELDESMNRSEFRAELIQALNLERQRMLEAIAPRNGP